MDPKELAALKKIIAEVIKEKTIPEQTIAPAAKKVWRGCQACLENQPNQIAHYGGCLPDIEIGETWSDMEKK
jgi:hypothetical protein